MIICFAVLLITNVTLAVVIDYRKRASSAESRAFRRRKHRNRWRVVNSGSRIGHVDVDVTWFFQTVWNSANPSTFRDNFRLSREAFVKLWELTRPHVTKRMRGKEECLL